MGGILAIAEASLRYAWLGIRDGERPPSSLSRGTGKAVSAPVTALGKESEHSFRLPLIPPTHNTVIGQS